MHFHPVTPDRLQDLAQFSTDRGKFRHCSCMRWRLTSTEFRRSTKEERIAVLDDLVRGKYPSVSPATLKTGRLAGALLRPWRLSPRLDAVGSFQELTMPPSGPLSASSWIGAIADKASRSSYRTQQLSMREPLVPRSLKGIP